MKKEFHLTKAGLAELQEELAELEGRRKDVAEKIKTAKEFGDLTENAEYHSARAEQAQVEGRISEINHILKNVQIIQEPTSNSSVQLGSTVVLKSEDGASRTLTVVGSVEADPLVQKISDESPIGQAVMGKKVGESVQIKTPNGPTTYSVEKIQ
jgi:transcription elongation factor GreA